MVCRTWPIATIGPFGHANSMCVLAPAISSTLLAEILVEFHDIVSALDCTCHRHASAPCRLAAGPQNGPRRWPARNGGPKRRSRSPSSTVPTKINTSGQSMQSRIFWCADHALGWSVACTGLLRASWPGELIKTCPRAYRQPFATTCTQPAGPRPHADTLISRTGGCGVVPKWKVPLR